MDVDLCEECETAAARLACEDCELVYCPPCSARIHRKGARARHTLKKFSPRGGNKGSSTSEVSEADNDSFA
jgi:hypothetical protein